MCKIFEDLKEQGRQEGRQEERQKMIKTFEDLKEQGRQEERVKMAKTLEDLKEQGRQEERKRMAKRYDDIKEQGKLENSISNVHKLVYKVYKRKAKWLDKCTINQLDKAIELILENLTYKEFKTKVTE